MTEIRLENINIKDSLYNINLQINSKEYLTIWKEKQIINEKLKQELDWLKYNFPEYILLSN